MPRATCGWVGWGTVRRLSRHGLPVGDPRRTPGEGRISAVPAGHHQSTPFLVAQRTTPLVASEPQTRNW